MILLISGIHPENSSDELYIFALILILVVTFAGILIDMVRNIHKNL
jgi:hypothetical protein